jgi:hypothetical protein
MLNPSTKFFVSPDGGFLLVGTDIDGYARTAAATADTAFESRSDILPKGCPYLNDDNNIHKCFYPQYFAYNI